MNEVRVNGLRGVELNVFDLKKSSEFYRNVWGLEEAATEGSSTFLRATGREHHIVALHEKPRASLAAMNFSARDKRMVDALHAKVSALGVKVTAAPAALPAVAGGGYGFSLVSPEGQTITISADVEQHPDEVIDSSRPLKLSHIVLNVEDIDRNSSFRPQTTDLAVKFGYTFRF